MSNGTQQWTDKHAEDRARVAVLEVTKAVLGEVGYQRLRVEAVASRAGVPRVWLRRWWTTRPLLVAEALQRMGGPLDVVPTGDVRVDVRAVVLRTATFLANPVVGEALAGLAADAARDPVAADRLAALLNSRRAGDVSVLLSAVARGDLRPDTDVGLVLDLVYGSLMFRLAGGTPPTPAVVEKLVDLVLSGQTTPVEQPVDGYGFDGYGIGGPETDGSVFDEPYVPEPAYAGRRGGPAEDAGAGNPLDGYRLAPYAPDEHPVDGRWTPSDQHATDQGELGQGSIGQGRVEQDGVGADDGPAREDHDSGARGLGV